MHSTIVDTDGGWEVHARLVQASDDYYVTTVYHPDVEPGDTVDVLIDEDAQDPSFTGVVLGTDPVVTVTPEVRNAF